MRRRQCFVIMPFSTTASCSEEEWATIFETVIKPSVENAGLDYECKRSAATRGNLVRHIIESLSEAHVVIADLTDQNPNVFYELGVRHALKNRTILIAQTRDAIPFDLRPYANHVYTWNTGAGVEEFEAKIRELLLEVDERPDRPDNPVSDFLRAHPGHATLPSNWWQRPGAPQFHLDLASSKRPDEDWTYEFGLRQLDGGDIGDLRYAYSIGDTRFDWQQPRLRDRRLWRLQPLKFRPEGKSIELHLKFYWDGDERLVVHRWEREDDFQTPRMEIHRT